MADEKIATADYWVEHLRKPVRFSDGMQILDGMGVGTYLEMGPHPVLVTMGSLFLPGPDILWLSSLRRGQSEWESMLECLGQLYVHGLEINWQAFERDHAPARQRVALPSYPFERQRYWIEPDRSSSPAKPASPAPQADAPPPVPSDALESIIQQQLAIMRQQLLLWQSSDV
jgi:acyl transferase domain-containing protein